MEESCDEARRQVRLASVITTRTFFSSINAREFFKLTLLIEHSNSDGYQLSFPLSRSFVLVTFDLNSANYVAVTVSYRWNIPCENFGCENLFLELKTNELCHEKFSVRLYP